MTKSPDFSLILAVYACLLVFGVLYNQVVAYLERHKLLEGFVSLAVAGGCLAVLGGLAVFSWQFALLALGAFVAAGLPMGLGSIMRYALARKHMQDAVRRGGDER